MTRGDVTAADRWCCCRHSYRKDLWFRTGVLSIFSVQLFHKLKGVNAEQRVIQQIAIAGRELSETILWNVDTLPFVEQRSTKKGSHPCAKTKGLDKNKTTSVFCCIYGSVKCLGFVQ